MVSASLKILTPFLFIIYLAHTFYIDEDDYTSIESIRTSDANPSLKTYRDFHIQAQLKYIQENNEKPPSQRSFLLEPNMFFLGYTPEQREEKFFTHLPGIYINGVKYNPKLSSLESKKHIKLKSYNSVDHEAAGMTPPIVNQLKCGGCYSFSAAFSMYNEQLRTTGKKMVISKQQGIDCGAPFGSFGCSGGYPHYVFKMYRDIGYTSEQQYPYRLETAQLGKQFPCRTISPDKLFKIKGWEVGWSNPNRIIALLGKRVVSVGVSANNMNFINYKSGILDWCGLQLTINHAINLVGAIYDSATDQYVIKIANSWGVQWGEKGYARISLKNGACGIFQYYSVPLKDQTQLPS